MSVLIIATGLTVRMLYWLAMRGITARTQAWMRNVTPEGDKAA
jgi:hypothetical protein